MSSLDGAAVPRRGRRRRRRWREGGSSTARWDVELLGWAVCAVGVGVIGAHLAPALFPVETAAGGAQGIIWTAMAAPVALAFARSRPRGLLRFRAIDVVYGLVFGILLRLAQGAVAGIGDGDAPWPSVFSTDGGLPPGFVVDAVAGSLFTPTIEELLFRGVVLVSAYAVLRRSVGGAAAGIAAVAVSTALFVAAHELAALRDPADLVALTLLSVVAGAFTIGTGRIWPAVAVHVVFNASGFALFAAGTLLS
ncbi:CPBP family intramembrane glutamic endopeptidase [Microbacterium sp. lyk4-40-TSB-66]|uniref:CPBP family intramembrane glutamic endopeptidase n=1 Tax=Microbacterium sp. lyk4-40-TSB-66 TaxID=3040294 RepID=UPI0025518FF2|nr:CPBP family intramembrane glutamic endopeptidase [Microbacterium sp. lyk4-40-TSB-66]